MLGLGKLVDGKEEERIRKQGDSSAIDGEQAEANERRRGLEKVSLHSLREDLSIAVAVLVGGVRIDLEAASNFLRLMLIGRLS